jgi:hypothetical protein
VHVVESPQLKTFHLTQIVANETKQENGSITETVGALLLHVEHKPGGCFEFEVSLAGCYEVSFNSCCGSCDSCYRGSCDDCYGVSCSGGISIKAVNEAPVGSGGGSERGWWLGFDSRVWNECSFRVGAGAKNRFGSDSISLSYSQGHHGLTASFEVIK